ncbi:AI-2E family transporter [Alkalilimnicola ehrlichii]|uniref:AI-2E family transporter n=1 Tax=Alkalilimnicola ehrlichii TaxID=351052 RepID=UPI0015F248A0|nr:AI-2E family transporter [Alkalilimnicola ehrlichii]
MGISDQSRSFAQRVLIAAGLIALVALFIYFLGQLIDVLLLAFAGVLIAVAIDGLTRLVMRYLPLSRAWALLSALAGILLLIGGFGALIGPQIAEQLPQLVRQLPEAVREVTQALRQLPGGENLLREAEQPAQFLNEEMLARLGGVFSSVAGAFAGLLIMALFAIYIALNPKTYVEQVLRLLPKQRRTRVAEVAAAQGQTLRLWLLSRLVSMVFVGAATAIGLSVLGVPLALTLGLISGVLTFIPYLGPILAAIPTVLVALLVSPQLAMYAALLYFAVEAVESNLLYPLIAKGVVHLPPAYTLIIQLAGGAVAGLPGIILATPLAVVAVVAVQMLYIQDVLGEDVEVLGES